MRSKTIVFAVATFVSMMFHACDKEDSITDASQESSVAVTVSDLMADPADSSLHGRFQYFSLKTGSVIPFADSASTKWDIAFRSTSIRTNSGGSGPGAGGGVVVSGTSFEALTEAPATGYAIDSNATSPAIKTGSGNGWYNYDPTTNIISPIPGKVLVVRTADGKYAKVEILSYYKGAPSPPAAASISRYFKFRYFYQPDGSRKLQ